MRLRNFGLVVTGASLVAVMAACGDDETGTTSSNTSTSSATGSANGGSGGSSSTASANGGSTSVGGASTTSTGGTGGGAGNMAIAFVLQGHVARTTLSCDAGTSWVEDRSDDQNLVCWVPPNNEPDCDHAPGAGRGVTVGNGWAVATFGWGAPGGIRRSNNGVNWQEVVTGTTFGGVAYGNGAFLAAAERPQRSTDDGATWTELNPVGFNVNIRRFAHVPHGGGKFIMVGDGDTVAISSDAGDTWSLPNVPAGCTTNMQTNGGIRSNNDVIVFVGGDGHACVSSDGQNWSMNVISANIRSQLIFDGTDFMVWSNGRQYKSVDGAAWTETMMPSNVDIGVVEYGNGAYAAVNGGWQAWYSEQRFYRSTDGLNWTTLDTAMAPGSHPPRAMAFGALSASANCQ